LIQESNAFDQGGVIVRFERTKYRKDKPRSHAFGDVDPNPFAPLHRQLGIQTIVYRVATLDYIRSSRNGERINNHLYRVPVTLARI